MVRIYGVPPYRVAVLHGGPGAAGEVGPVAKMIGRYAGAMEPFQTVNSVEGQVLELVGQLKEQGTLPVILVGYSWGCWLGWMVAARYPELVQKLILVSCPVYKPEYVRNLMAIRKSRLTATEGQEVDQIMAALQKGATGDALLQRFGQLMEKADGYDVEETLDGEAVECNMSIYQGVWPEAAEMRENGSLLELGKSIECPVVVVHGVYDPSPGEGVKVPLQEVLTEFRFASLDHCGHSPWKERQAKDIFYALLQREVEAGLE